MNSSSNPLIRPQTPFEKRVVEAIERGKPGRSVGPFIKPLPGGSSLTVPRQRAPATPTHSFKVTRKSANVFRVQGGTFEGQTITTQEIDVGGTRPVAILMHPKYTLDIHNSEYVWRSTVKTGADKPSLTSSTTILSDISAGISSAGDEARAIIALIADPNIIVQIAHGNIYGSWADDGTFEGKMAGTFVKSA